jgi:glycosyltransferase involved in cell wall biosynthesis
MTAPEPAALPDGWESIWMERVLSSKFATAFPRLGSYTEYLLRLYMAAVLLWRRRRSDAIVTGRYGEFFALAQGLWPFGRRPLLLLDIEWYSAHRSGWRGKLKRWLHRRMAAGADAIQVFCRIEAANYAARFGIPAKKFVWIPYCFSVPDSPEGAEGGFAFSGGLHHRDYPTLFAAVAGLPLELQVAAPRSHFADASVPPNVTILGVVSGDEYWRKMREARFVVVSLESGLARCPGVITYVAAMRMGKCAVVNEPSGAPDYIESGISGFVVPAGDAASLRRQIVSLVENEGLAGTVGSQAKLEAAERFSPAAYYSAVKAVVDRLIALS